MARISRRSARALKAHTMARISIWKTPAEKSPSLPTAHTMARIIENRRRRAFDTHRRAFDTDRRAKQQVRNINGNETCICGRGRSTDSQSVRAAEEPQRTEDRSQRSEQRGEPGVPAPGLCRMASDRAHPLCRRRSYGPLFYRTSVRARRRLARPFGKHAAKSFQIAKRRENLSVAAAR